VRKDGALTLTKTDPPVLNFAELLSAQA
jgi:hypothetical protein